MKEKCKSIKAEISRSGWARSVSDVRCNEEECSFVTENNPYPDMEEEVKFTCTKDHVNVDLGVTYDTWVHEQSEHKVYKMQQRSYYLDRNMFDSTVEENEIDGEKTYDFYLYGNMYQKYENNPSKVHDEVISNEVKRASDFMTESMKDVVLSGKYP
jgi:hypothetical protein